MTAGEEPRTLMDRKMLRRARAAQAAEARRVESAARRIKPTLHDAHVMAYRGLSDTEHYRWRYRSDIEFAIKERLRRQFRKQAEAVPGIAELIRQALKKGRRSLRAESVLGYSITQLKDHLERQFTKGMSWDEWSKGGIHIDHILPRKCFDVATIEGVQAYWALSNLRPLHAIANLKKSDKVQFLL